MRIVSNVRSGMGPWRPHGETAKQAGPEGTMIYAPSGMIQQLSTTTSSGKDQRPHKKKYYSAALTLRLQVAAAATDFLLRRAWTDLRRVMGGCGVYKF